MVVDDRDDWRSGGSKRDREIIGASERGELGVVRSLLDKGAKVNAIVNGRYIWTPSKHAAFRGHEGVVRLLLDRRADTFDHCDRDYFSALTLAAGAEHMDTVKLLGAGGADSRQARTGPR